MRSCIKPQQFSGLGETRSGPMVHIYPPHSHHHWVLSDLKITGQKGFQDFLLLFILPETMFLSRHPQVSAAKRQSCIYPGTKRSKTRRKTEESWRQESRRKTWGWGEPQLAQGSACSCCAVDASLPGAGSDGSQTGNRGTVTGTLQEDNYNLGSASVG